MKLYDDEYVSAGGKGDAEPPRGFDILLLIVSFIFAAIAMVPAQILYTAIENRVYGPLMIMLVIGLFYFLFGLFVMVFGKIRKTPGERQRKDISAGKNFIISLLIVLVASFLFEFIYELGAGFKFRPATSYTFLIDDSGSMTGNDYNNVRYQVIKPIMENEKKGFPFALYSFSDDIVEIRSMKEREDVVPEFQMPQGREMGGTALMTSLDQTVNDIISGKINAGANPKIILLSDGSPTDMTYLNAIDPVLEKCADNNIVVSTIGLKHGIDDKLMRRIADATGGLYVLAEDVSDLQSTMAKAAVGSSGRNLLGYRGYVKPSFLYVIERILFMGIIGVIIGIGVMHVIYILPQQLTFYSTFVKAALAGILLELLINLFNASIPFANAVYFILVGIILAQYYMVENRNVRSRGGKDEDEVKWGAEAETGSDSYGKDDDSDDGIRRVK